VLGVPARHVFNVSCRLDADDAPQCNRGAALVRRRQTMRQEARETLHCLAVFREGPLRLEDVPQTGPYLQADINARGAGRPSSTV
jgi:hypothetical protein